MDLLFQRGTMHPHLAKCWFRADQEPWLRRSVHVQHSREHCSSNAWAERNPASPRPWGPASSTKSVSVLHGQGHQPRSWQKVQLLCLHRVCGLSRGSFQLNNNKSYWVFRGFISNDYNTLQKLCFLQMFMSSFVTIIFSCTKINIAEGYKTILTEFLTRFSFLVSFCYRVLVGCWWRDALGYRKVGTWRCRLTSSDKLREPLSTGYFH